ncbi:MAG: sigma-54 dependent transcriptional regulator [bacterium]
MKTGGKIFLVDDDQLIIAMLSRALRHEGYTVRAETRTEAIVDKIHSWRPDVLLLDVRLQDTTGIEILTELMKKETPLQVIMLTADDTAETAVKAMKLGAADYLTKPFDIDEVKIVIRNILDKVRLQEEVGYLRGLYSEDFDRAIVGESPGIKGLVAEVDRVAHAGVSTVLITGESGTGKELVARRIHRGMFPEEVAPFIQVNCAALPDTLLETELFGYMKGAFTDAKADKKGLLEQADMGCLLLDEIGEMKPDLQSKLLRVLEERKVRRVGGEEEIPVEVTVIATTNRDLSGEVDKGMFRLDLFYRLSTFRLHVPALRERKEDIPLLTKYFLAHFASKYNKKVLKGFSPEVEQRLTAYQWPGNIRELRNVLERIVVLQDTETILPEHLPVEIRNPQERARVQESGRFILPDSGISLEELERDLILQALQKTKNNRTLAAKLLGVTYDTLRYQIKKFGLE